MADNVAVTAGAGTTIAADEVVDGTLGTVKVQFVKLMDGTLDGTSKAVVGANGLKVDGSGITQPVSGTVSVNPLPTGSNVIGKVSIDQTTPGTTNLVSIGTNGTVTAKTQDGSGNAITSATRGAERALTVQVVDGSGTQVTSFGGSSPTNTLLNITTNTTTTAKSGAGTLVRIVVNQTGTTASTATIYDNTTATGTKIGTLDTLGRTGSFTYDGAFSTGLTIVTTGGSNLTIVYR